MSPSGGVRRTDIQHVAAMLGVSAVGVSRRPAFEPELELLVDFDAPLPAPETIHALSMYDVLPLAAWWEALEAADVIERSATRVRPGSAAKDWVAERMPPHDVAEMVAGVFVAQLLTHDLLRGYGLYEEDVVVEAIRRVLQALAPGVIDEADDGGATSIFAPRALAKLQHLHDAGLLATGASGEAVVPVELRGAVAHGVVLTMALLAGDDE